jgi:two-component system LytT family sensor kinase
VLRRVPAPPQDFSTLLHQLGIGSVTWYAVVVAFPFLLWGARHIDVSHERRRRAVLLGLGMLITFVAATAATEYFIVYGVTPGRPGFLQYFPVGLRENVLPWLAAAGIVVAVEARRRSVHATLERERLRAEVAEQRLIALTGQLHPHFLFNTLQGISTLIHRDAEAADEMLAKLSDLLRDVLRHRHHVLVPIEDELRFVRTYLEIAQLRFADRLTFELDVAPEVAEASVPLFILQPLVENALSHGIGGRARGGRVRVRAWKAADRLLMEVADDGAGLPNGAPAREGIGLSNTRERLRASYGDDQRLTIEGRTGGGTVARIEIPYRRHKVPSPPAVSVGQ